MNITLSQSEYNATFQLLSIIKGKDAITASRLIEQMRGKANNGEAKEIEVSVENYELESVLQGIKLLVLSEGCTVNDLNFFTYVCGLLKIKGALNKVLSTVVDKNATVEIDSDLELDAN